jgi:hypothetical protein
MWTRTNGDSSISADLSAAGTKTITLTPCPHGVAASDTKIWLRISGGVGTAETVQLTGVGTCTSNADTGTVQVVTANTHTGAWSVGSATFREAVNVASRGDVLVGGAIALFASTVVDKSVTIACGSAFGDVGVGCTMTAFGNFHVIDIDTFEPVVVDGIAIIAASQQTSGSGIRIGFNGSAYHNCGSVVRNTTISAMYDGIHLKDSCKSLIQGNFINQSERYAIYVQNIFCPDCGDGVILENNIHNPSTLGDAGIRFESAGGLRIVNNKVLDNFAWGIDVNANTASAPTAYLQVQGNNLDRMTGGGVRLASTYDFGLVRVEGNVITALGAGSTCVLIESSVQAVDVDGNTCTAETYGVRVTGGAGHRIGANHYGPYPSSSNPTPVSATVEVAIDSPVTLKYSQLPADVTDGSIIFCSDCNSSCTAGSSTGAFITRVNNAWQCDAGSGSFFTQGGNSFGATAELGTNDEFDLQFRRNGVAVGDFGSNGFTSEGYLRSLVGGIDARLQSNCGVAACVGIFGANDFGFVSDSTVRWRLTSAGMFHPEVHDTYDIGLTGTRVRTVYAGAGEFYKSSGTASSDYVKTRKLTMFDASGSIAVSASWDLQCDVYGVGVVQNSFCYMRDNAGNNVWRAERIVGGSSLDRTLWYTDLVPDTNLGQNLGSASLQWGTIWVDQVGSSLLPTATNTYVLGNSSKRWSNVATAGLDVSGSGTIVFSSGAVNGYVWTSDASGVGSWQAAGGGSFFTQGGNSFGATAVLGTNDNYDLQFERNNTNAGDFGIYGFTSRGYLRSFAGGIDSRLQSNCGVAACVGIFGANDFGFVSDSTVRWRLTSAGMFQPEIHDTYDVGLTGTRVRKVYARAGEFYKSSGTGSSDYVQTRKLVLYDTTGSITVPSSWDIQCDVYGVGVAQNSYCYMRDHSGNNVWKSERVVGGSVLDRTLWYTDLVPDTNLGQNLGSASLQWGTIWVDQVGSSLFPTATNTYVLGNSSKRWSNVATVDLSASGSITFSSGAVNGYVWTSNASGVGSWQATAGSLPVVDSTEIVKGSSDATKKLRFEVDGFTTTTTRVLTPQDASYTIAGTNIAQTFSGANTFSSGQTFNGSNTYNANQTYAGDIRFSTDNTYNIGVGATRPVHIFTRNFSMSASGYVNNGGTLNVQSGGRLDINSGGTLSANGSAGTSATKTVRASGGGSDCTLVFTNGILTGGTC